MLMKEAEVQIPLKLKLGYALHDFFFFFFYVLSGSLFTGSFFLHSFDKNLLSTYHVPSILLGSKTINTNFHRA